MSEPIIDINDLEKSYQNGIKALQGVSLSILPGTFVTLIGPSGCGKTTLLRTINKMIDFDSGNITVMGRDIKSWDEIRLRRSIGYVIQSGALFPHLTIRQNIEFVLNITGATRDARNKRVDYLAHMMGFDKNQLDLFPSALSGGQQQRVGVARALALQPEIILMDEPLGALDNITRRNLQNELKEMHLKLGITFVMVTHDLQEAFKLGTDVAIMNEGKVVQYDTPENIQKKPLTDWVREFIK